MILRKNALKQRLRGGSVLLGCSFNESRDPGMVYTLAANGADVVFFDFEHNIHNTETVMDLVAHAHAAGISPLVRPPMVDEAWISRLLDGGCQSLLIPRLRTPQQVEQLVDLAMYQPRGSRGVAMVGGAGNNYCEVTDVPRAMEWANDQLLLGIVIETAQAVENLAEMLVPEIGLAVIGYQDLAHSYGVAGQMDHPLVIDAERQLAALCMERGIAYGAFRSDPAAIASDIEMGAQLIVHGGLLAFVRRGVRAAARAVQDAQARA
ncbi:HpcH/HpaI aldolase/citrate lyase family protein [Nocardia nova]|uniref:HpcH/HpaI aldolase family protein n=1 Tax=Nocardia nova TaxID=37330 RepID=UPI0037151A1B